MNNKTIIPDVFDERPIDDIINGYRSEQKNLIQKAYKIDKQMRKEYEPEEYDTDGINR